MDVVVGTLASHAFIGLTLKRDHKVYGWRPPLLIDRELGDVGWRPPLWLDIQAPVTRR